jgi:hypothetical protein
MSVMGPNFLSKPKKWMAMPDWQSLSEQLLFAGEVCCD